MDDKNVNLIKKSNLNILRNALMKVRSATKPQLSEATGISVVTINSLMKTLLENNEVLEDTTVQMGMGRPAVTYKYNGEYNLVLVIYMHEMGGKDMTYYSICNLYGEVIYTSETVLHLITYHSFDSIIEEMILKYPNIKMIGFGLPARETEGEIVASDYDVLLNVKLTTYIEEKFSCHTFLENDIGIATFGYASLYNILENQCIVGLYYPNKYPPGAGICLDGKILKGRDGMAGEVKHLPFDLDWNRDVYCKEELNEVIEKTIKIFMCLYNPHAVIIYCENVCENLNEKIVASCSSKVEKSMIPPIIVSDELNKHYKEGLIKLALKKLKQINEE